MTVTMESAPGPFRSSGERKKGRRDALLFGASAALHLLIFGPMIFLAQGDELEFKLPTDIPIIQVQLEPPPFLRPKPVPLPVPVPEPVRPQVTQPPVPTQAVKAEQPQERVEQQAINTPRPVTEIWPATRNLPQVAPQPTPPTEAFDTPQGASAVRPLESALPSVRPLPPQEVQTFEPAAVSPSASAISVTTSQVTASPSAADAVSQATSDLPVRRRLSEEEERALQAAAAGETSSSAASGPPSPPMPRLANPAPGAMAPPGGAGAGTPVPGISEAWRVAPSSQAGRNARALRLSPTGCRFPERLTDSERQLCREQFNADAARGAERPITGSGNAARDARFRVEGAREMYRYEERRRPLAGGSGNVGPADCPGSNFGTGCAGSLLDPSMQQDSTSNIRTNRDAPRPSGNRVPGSAGSTGRPGNGDDR